MVGLVSVTMMRQPSRRLGGAVMSILGPGRRHAEGGKVKKTA
jgi:hypothetical protein